MISTLHSDILQMWHRDKEQILHILRFLYKNRFSISSDSCTKMSSTRKNRNITSAKTHSWRMVWVCSSLLMQMWACFTFRHWDESPQRCIIHSVLFIFVPGHTDIEGIEGADSLATLPQYQRVNKWNELIIMNTFEEAARMCTFS